MRSGLALVLALLHAGVAHAVVEGPIERLSAAGSEPDVAVRADGSALVVWETAGVPALRVCRVAAGAGACVAGSERSLDGATGTTSRPFVFLLSGGRAVVVHGGCCPQRTFRYGSADDGATFAAGADFASLVPLEAALAGESLHLIGDPAAGTVGYQQASATTGGKVTQEATLDGTGGVTGMAVSSDGGRPFAAWAGTSNGMSSWSASGSPNLSTSWAAPAPLSGVTAVLLAGPHATWLRGGVREVARWSAGVFGTPAPLPYAAADAGAADLAVDPAGGAHLVFSPAGSNAVCYAGAPAGGGWGAPVLLGRDSDGVGALQLAAAGPGSGRVVFATASGIAAVPLAAATLTPNVCGLAPSSLRISGVAGSAALRAGLDPQGQDTTWRVEHGPTAAYGAASADARIPGTGGPAVAMVHLDVTPGTDYHARLVATNATGTTATVDAVFHAPTRLARTRPAGLVELSRRCRGRRATVRVRSRDGARPVLAAVRGPRGELRLGRRRLRDGETVRVAVPRRGGRVRVLVRLADGRVMRRGRSYGRC